MDVKEYRQALLTLTEDAMENNDSAHVICSLIDIALVPLFMIVGESEDPDRAADLIGKVFLKYCIQRQDESGKTAMDVLNECIDEIKGEAERNDDFKD